MTKTYVAWNGTTHKWPPPENWYRAKDGRWWHPSMGPQEHESALGEADPTNPIDIDFPVLDPVEPPSIDTNARESRSTETPPPSPGAGSEGPMGETTWEPPAGETGLEQVPGGPTPAGSRSRPGPLLAAAAIVVALIGGALLIGQLANGNNSANNADRADGTNTSDETADDAVDESAAGETSSSAAPTTDTTLAEGATPEAERDLQVNRFRSILAERDLSTEALTDGDIMSFGSAICVAAAAAEDAQSFDEVRSILIADSGALVPDDEVNVTISVAVVSFCPAEAVRLGIGADS